MYFKNFLIAEKGIFIFFPNSPKNEGYKNITVSF